MYCPQCGSPNHEDARFCMKCGVDLVPYRKWAPQARAARPQNQMAHQVRPQQPDLPPQPPAPPPTERGVSSISVESPPVEASERDEVSLRPDASQARVAASPASGNTFTRSAGVRLTAGVIPSGLQQVGYSLLELGYIGLFLLGLLQWYEGTVGGRLNDLLEDEVFVATRSGDVLTMGWGFLALAVLTAILTIGSFLLPRAGLGLRISGYVLMLLGVASGLVALWRGWADSAIYVLVLIPVLIVVGAVLVGKGAGSFRKEWKTRLGGNRLYRKRWLPIRLGVVAALWVFGAIGYVLMLTLDSGWTVQPGGYIGGVLLAVGVIGALALLAGLRGRPTLWIDAEGHLVDRAE